MKQLFAIISLLVLINFSQKCYSQNVEPTTSIDTIIERMRAETGILGMSAAIIKNKKVVLMKGYGYADKAANIPFTPETIMNVASIAKTFTGVCIMKAVEQGKLSLDEDINRYLPFKIVNPFYPNEKITLRHLATMTSGLIDRNPFYGDSTYFEGKDSPEPLGEFVKNYFVAGGKHYSKENFLPKKPGTYREYSNTGAALAAYIVEFTTGQRLNVYGKQHIFKPLEMQHTGWLISEVDLKRHSKLYDKKSDGIKEIPLYGLTTYPDGGVRTSVSDLSKFFISLLNEGKYQHTMMLKKESVAELTRFNYTASNKPENVKIEKLNQGIFWATKLGATRMGHNGSDHGVRTFMLADLKKEIGVIIFFNTSLGEEGRQIF